MTQHTDTSEKGFQKLIVKELLAQGYQESFSNDFDREFCINRQQLMQFIETTQKSVSDFISQKGERAFLVRLDKRIKDKGIIEVLRKGIQYFDKTIYLFYPQPNSVYNAKDKLKFESNIYSVTQELVYTDNNTNRLDLTVFINGFPLLTMELKNAFTHQSVKDAIRQYMYDRSSQDKIFNTGRCMVHFAADTTQVYMAGSLAGKNTNFFPFNKGLNDGKAYKPFGAGNPENPDGIKTSYLWEDILRKESLSNIIEKFATLLIEKDKETGNKKKVQIFPRYHQLKVVRELLQETKNNGLGNRFLIQHSAGSGKSNSITWLAHQLIGLYDINNENPLFDSVVVVTDRTVLDEQIRANIKVFAQVKRIVEAITGDAKDIKRLDPEEDSFSKTTHMRLALANNKKIITCTVQTFPFVLKAVQDMATKKVAIIIDEAHSSQSGDAAASMNALFADINSEDIPKDEEGKISTEDLLNYLIDGRKMLSNACYYAFTATPKNKTLETFGVKVPFKDEHGEDKAKHIPFHTYSMKQAIEEEFILDVLKNYTTWKSYYKIKEEGSVDGDEKYEVKEANKRIKSYVEGHEIAIKDKTKIIVDHFIQHVRKRINNQAKAMLVCKSIESAMKYKEAVDAYLKSINSDIKTIVAFSGKKRHWQTGEELTEDKMNAFKTGGNNIPKQFNREEYKLLIVANKYQTGFDQPLLHTMYVDKKLDGVQAVQTLSRLNRAKKPHKKETFVLDFFNDLDDIKEAFEPYYTTTILSEETDPNKLNDLQEILDDFQIYDSELVADFFKSFYDISTDRNTLDSIIDGVVSNFNEELLKDQQIVFKSSAKTFVRTYAYLSRLMEFNMPYWEMLWLFLKHLIPMLVIEDDDEIENIIEAIDMKNYLPIQQSDQVSIILEGIEGYVDPIPVEPGGGNRNKEYESLENIVNAFNSHFGNIDWGEGVDAEEAETILTKTIPEKLKQDTDALLSILNSDKSNAKDESDQMVKELMQKLMFTNTGIYKKFADDKDFKNRYEDFVFDILWKQARGDKQIGL